MAWPKDQLPGPDSPFTQNTIYFPQQTANDYFTGPVENARLVLLPTVNHCL